MGTKDDLRMGRVGSAKVGWDDLVIADLVVQWGTSFGPLMA